MISIRRAASGDAAQLAELVNTAYAVEQFFVDGARTTAAEIAALTNSFLVLEQSDGRLVAAVMLEPRGQAAYLGMLSVSPAAQGHGLGTRLVAAAEALAEAMGCAWVDLKIVNLREELGRWYRSLGYQEVSTAPYTHRPVKQPCHFVEMRKRLRASVAAA
jgi:N-acetylglutamate synthase-like GNAT family acetyltransferase|nr:GNAT family N-acetyltransferase [Kofleriaceae bacterium]